MTLFAVSSSSSILFDSSNPVCKIDWSVASDFMVFDYTEAITYTRKSALARNDSGVMTETSTQVRVDNALRREVNGRDIYKYGGVITARDTKWELPALQLPAEPAIGDRITEVLTGIVFSIILVDRSTFSSRWRCFARRV